VYIWKVINALLNINYYKHDKKFTAIDKGKSWGLLKKKKNLR